MNVGRCLHFLAHRSRLVGLHKTGFLEVRSISSTMVSMKELESMVRIEPVTFDLGSGGSLTLESHIQDTLPSGSSVGTVVCIHGAPGSHKDFKYVTPHLNEKGIRVVGINFPGYGLTEGHEKLNFDNTERNNFVKAVIDKVGVNDRLVVMGHSRGCENATGSASMVTDKLAGLVLLNPTGLRLHRGLRPFWLVTAILWLHNIGSFVQTAMESFLYFFYNKIGLRLNNGKQAVACVRTMSNIELDKLKPKIDTINKSEKAKVVQAYSGKDLFIETEVSKELADSWHDHKEVICAEKSPDATESTFKKAVEHLQSGTKSVSVNFVEEDHFLQKHQAKFVADTIEVILKQA